MEDPTRTTSSEGMEGKEVRGSKSTSPDVPRLTYVFTLKFCSAGAWAWGPRLGGVSLFWIFGLAVFPFLSLASLRPFR